jgi:hypothetical protein
MMLLKAELGRDVTCHIIIQCPTKHIQQKQAQDLGSSRVKQSGLRKVIRYIHSTDYWYIGFSVLLMSYALISITNEMSHKDTKGFPLFLMLCLIVNL